MSVTFPSGRTAAVVEPGPGAKATDVVDDLGLAPGGPVLVVVGGADSLTTKAEAVVKQAMAPAVARAAALVRATVVDGGTRSGVMSVVGEAIGQLGGKVALVGVAPAKLVSNAGSTDETSGEKASLEPNHTHFVLTDGAEWGSETHLLLDVSAALAAGSRVVMVVAGGGPVARKEVLEATRRGWPIFVVTRTGGLADEIRAASKKRRFTWLRRRGGEDVREIVANGDVRLSETDEPGALARRLAWELQDEDVLKDAWQAFATYDALAKTARKTFEKLQNWILALGILATALALLKSALDIDPQSSYSWVDDVLHWTVVVLPIFVAVLIGITYRLAAGNRWVLLRGAAETIKREIYRYRTGAGDYRRAPAASPTPRECLGVQLESIRMKLLQTEASGAELTPYAGPLPPEMYGASRDDDGLSPLDASRYLKLRVGEQLSYYHPKVASLARTRGRFQLVVLVAGGAGAIVAAAGQEIWVGLTTAIAAAAVAYLHSRQIENTLVAYNQAAGKLEALRTKWLALTDEQRKDDAAFEALVNDGETILATELGGWVLQMTEALEELRSSQLEEARKSGIGEPDGQQPAAEADRKTPKPTDRPGEAEA